MAVLLRMTWIAAKGRADLLKHCHVAIIAGRLKILPPGVLVRGDGGTIDFTWSVYRRETVRGTCWLRA